MTLAEWAKSSHYPIDKIDKIMEGGSGPKSHEARGRSHLGQVAPGQGATGSRLRASSAAWHPRRFDTSKICSICGGAFVGLKDIIAEGL
jgi:ATP-dependent protease Clp ATPase subunit